MKILVTGGAGFIGSHVVDRCLDAGHEVVVVDNLSTGRRSNLNPAARFYHQDLLDPELASVFERERPEVISHHAAQVDVRRSVSDPVLDARVNVVGSLHVLECARRFGVRRVIYASSGGTVYGEPASLPCDETHPINPLCPYGASKHAVEHYLAMYQVAYGLEFVVLRYANVYGPRQDPQGEAGVVAIFAGQMLADGPVTIHGDGEQERDFLYVADCAEANWLALSATPVNSVFNLGTGKPTSVNRIFSMLQQQTGYRRPALHDPPKLGETRRIYLDSRKLSLAWGWAPTVDLEEGLRRTVDHFRRAQSG